MINPIDSENVYFTYATYERLSSRAIELAHQINQRKLLLGLYGLLDGLDIASKTLAILVPLLSTISLDAWALTPEGYYLSLLFVLSIATLSALGSIFNGSKNNLEKTISRFWQSLRDPLKGGKVAGKAIKNILFLAHTLAAHDISATMSPLTMPIILFFMANRIFSRAMGNQRKDFQETNKALLRALEHAWEVWDNAPEGLEKSIAKNHYLNFVTEAKNNQLKSHSDTQKITLFVSNFIETLINATYMFLGTAALVPSSPACMMFVTCVSIAMLFANLLSAWHEEHEYQIKLQRTEQAFHVACAMHELERSLTDKRIAFVGPKHLELKHEQDKYHALYKSSVFEAIFVGLRYAVGTHKAIMGGLFFVAVLSSLILGAALPETLVVVCIGLSAVASIALSMYSVEETRQHSQKQDRYIHQQDQAITQHIADRLSDTTSATNPHHFFMKHTKSVPLKERTLLKEAEKARSCFAGSRKPKKLLDFCMKMQGVAEYDVDDAPQSRLLLGFGVVCYCLIWWDKAHIKQYGNESSWFESETILYQ